MNIIISISISISISIESQNVKGTNSHKMSQSFIDELFQATHFV